MTNLNEQTKKKVAIVQSNYIPWRGYFDLISSVDEFILYDDMQYTKRDWRNRNKIKTSDGLKWLTIPIINKGKYTQKISETKIDGTYWMEKHWKSIVANYKNAAYFSDGCKIFEELYHKKSFEFLSEVNMAFIEVINKFFNIKTNITWSANYKLEGDRNYKLASIAKQAGATHYISGPSARGYLDLNTFNELGLAIEWFDYSNYPEYKQLWGAFEGQVSIIDLIMNTGKASKKGINFVKT